FGDVRSSDIAEAEKALMELDLAALVLRAARNGRLTTAMVRRLDATDRFGDLAEAERSEVLTAYLKVATPTEFVADQHLLTKYWLLSVNTGLESFVRRQINDQASTVADFINVAQITVRVGSRDCFVRAVASSGSPVRRQPGREILATVMIKLAEEED